jgi:hypothetical protein
LGQRKRRKGLTRDDLRLLHAQKPYWMVFNMFLGMSGCLLPSLFSALFAACGRVRKSARTGMREPLLDGAEAEAEAPAEEAPPADGRLKLRGLKGLLVVGAPTVRFLAPPDPCVRRSLPHACPGC